jgi:uracil phosphoribosyltransferase
MGTTVVNHPLVASQLTRLRDASTPPGVFRRALNDLSAFLIYEASRHVEVDRVEVDTPLAKTSGLEVREPPIVVPVLRAGLGMLDAALSLFPDAPVGFVGLRRDEETLLPSTYVATVPARLEGRRALVLDPMLATGGSLLETCRLLADSDAGQLVVTCVLAAPEGVEAVAASPLDIDLFVAHIDERLDENGYIYPGIGDAGDREWGAF